MSDACHAHLDGDCYWERCPQIRDGEPEASGRHCPLDVLPEENDGTAGRVVLEHMEDSE